MEDSTNTEKSSNLPIEVAEQFVQLQMKEIEIKRAELELKKQQDKNNYDFSKESLKVQAEDLKDQRAHQSKREKRSNWVLVLLFLLFFTIVVLAIFLNKDQLLFEIIKVIVLLFGGGATGYTIGLNKKFQKQQNQQAQNQD